MIRGLPVARLQDVADLNPSLPVIPLDHEEVSFLPMSAVDASLIDAVDAETRLYREVRKGYTPFATDDVLVAKITPCFENGKIAQAKLTRLVGFGSTEFHVVRPHVTQLDPRFLVHFLRQQRIRKEGERRMTGSAGQRRVPAHFLANLSIPVPSLPEQWRIANILDKADALRAKRRAALAQLDALTQSLFLDMFGDPATNPKGWPICPISEYVQEFQGGKSFETEAGENAPTRNRILKVSAVTGNKYRPDQSKPVPDSYRPHQEHFVRNGDLLFSRANTAELVGDVALVDKTPPNILLPDKLWRFVWCDPTQIEPAYVWSLFQSEHLRQEIGRRATGTSGSMKNISQEKVLGIRSMLPPIEHQRKFGAHVEKIRQISSTAKRNARVLDALFASLQHRAFRGEL